MKEVAINNTTTTWIVDYLTNRPQFVRLKGCVSEKVVSSTEAPQTTVLSTRQTYTMQHYTTQSAVISRWLQFSAVSEMDKRPSTGNKLITLWCGNNQLVLNTNKTNEMTGILGELRMSKHCIHPRRRGGGGWEMQIPRSLPGEQTEASFKKEHNRLLR